jgi:parallel beta-helix repeat protein
MNKIIFSLFILFLGLIFVNTVLAVDIASCQKITTSGEYTLTNDVISNGTCFDIQADNVILDCNGYSLTGIDSNFGSNGVSNYGGYDHVTVKNCIITGYGNGIDFEGGGSFETIKRNLIHHNNYAGIHFDSVSGSEVLYNSIFSNTGHGIGFHFSTNSDIFNNTIYSNGFMGISMWEGSNENDIIDNYIYSNGGGIQFGSSSNNYIFSNRFNNRLNVFQIDSPNYWNSKSRGNFWMTPSESGFSQTCIDEDDDGICDEEFDIALPDNVDYFPLALTDNDDEVPEFGVVAGAVALIGALGIFLYRRKN